MIFEKYLLELLSMPGSRVKPQVGIDLLYFIKSKCCFSVFKYFKIKKKKTRIWNRCRGRNGDSTFWLSWAARPQESPFFPPEGVKLCPLPTNQGAMTPSERLFIQRPLLDHVWEMSRSNQSLGMKYTHLNSLNKWEQERKKEQVRKTKGWPNAYSLVNTFWKVF